MKDTLGRLAAVLENRKNKDAETSYVASLYHKGTDAILKKLGEEATELIIAAKSEDKQSVIHETADLWFHSLVLLSSLDLTPDHVLAELERRYGRPGLKEKAERTE